MKQRLVASLGAFLLLLPGGAAATSIVVPVAQEGGGTLVGFEIESMEDRLGDEDMRSIRYLGRITVPVRGPLVLSFRFGGSEIDVDSEIHGTPITFEGRPKLSLGLGAAVHAPLPVERMSWFADAGILYSLSNGRTGFTTTVQSSTFHEEYENRYRWLEYQAGGGLHWEMPAGGAWLGLLGRTVDGKVWRETYQTGSLVSSGSDDFSKAFELFAVGGFDFRLSGRMVLSVGGYARDGDRFSWTVSVGEFSW